MFSLIRTTAHACLTLGFKDSGFSLLIAVQLRGFYNSLHHQRRLSRYIGLWSVMVLSVMLKVCILQQMTIVVWGQVY